MAFDHARGTILLFGGIGPGGRLDDTWEWDGNTWTRLITTKSPPSRYWHAMASDTARKRIVLFGGTAKDRPYPNSLTVTTVNGGVSTMILSLATQLAPIRVNAIHPSIVGDSPFWAATPPEVLESFRARTPLGRLVEIDDVAHATEFLLENRAVNAINLRVDGGFLAT